MNRPSTPPLVACAAGPDRESFRRLEDRSPAFENERRGEQRGRPRTARPLTWGASGIAGGGLLLAAVSVALPWLRVGAGGSLHLYAGTSLTVIAVAMIALPVAGLGAVAICAARRNRDAKDFAMLAAAAIAAIAGVLLLLVETASAVIPNGLLPATVRRYTLDLRAGPGLWLALTGGAFALAALSGRLELGIGLPGLSRRGRPTSQIAAQIALLTTLTALAVGFGFLRYASWVQATALRQSYGIGGWGLPWVGPVSLVAMLGLIAATAIALSGRESSAGLFAAISGWLITFAAALAIVATDALGSLRVTAFAPASLRGYAPHLAVGASAVISFGLGIAAAIVGGVMLWRAGGGQRQ